MIKVNRLVVKTTFNYGLAGVVLCAKHDIIKGNK